MKNDVFNYDMTKCEKRTLRADLPSFRNRKMLVPSIWSCFHDDDKIDFRGYNRRGSFDHV